MILEVDGLQIHYSTRAGAVRAVDGASFAVPEGRIVGLVGESGCGKTTAVRAIMGVLAENGRRAGGRVVFKGQTIDEHATRKLLWRDIAYVPQSAMSSLDPVYTVGAQLVEVLTKRGNASRARRPRPRGRTVRPGGLERKPARRLSAPVLRRHAPARRHRHGAGAETQPAAGRRAGDGARRHRAAPDPRHAARAAAAAPALHGAGDARHQRRGLSLRRCRRDVCRPGDRERPGARGAGAAAPSLHDGPAQRLPRPAVGRAGAGADRAAARPTSAIRHPAAASRRAVPSPWPPARQPRRRSPTAAHGLMPRPACATARPTPSAKPHWIPRHGMRSSSYATS